MDLFFGACMGHYLRQACDHRVISYDADHGGGGPHRARGGEYARAGKGSAASAYRGNPTGVLGAFCPRRRIQNWPRAAHRLWGGNQALVSREYRLGWPLIGQGDGGFIGDMAHRFCGGRQLFCKRARRAWQEEIAEHHRAAFWGTDVSGAGPAKANGHVRFHRIGRSHTGIGVNSGGNIHREDWNSTLFGFGIGAERGTGKAAGGGEAGDGVDKQIGILQTVHNGSAGRGKRLQCGFVGAIRREDGLD